MQLADPVDRLISWLDEIQVGATSFARLVGIARVPPDRTATDETPDDEHLIAQDVRYAYVADRDVLHGIDLDLKPGERVAVVGPSGAGKSTLGRLLAGIHPPRVGRVDVGGVRLVDLPLEALRKEVALVTQEQHVFVGTLDENLSLARPGANDEQLQAALEAVDAHEWADALPEGRDTVVGAGGYPADARAGAAARARAARARGPAHARARRGDVAARPARGAPPRALARLRARRAHRGRDRAPAAHGARRRPRRGGRGRPARGDRHARRARRTGRLVRRALGLMAQRAVDTIIAEARAEIAAGRVPDSAALRARIRAEGGGDDALAQLERVFAIQRARARLSREVASPAKRGPSLRTALKTKVAVNANMDVRRGEGTTLVWDPVKAVTGWEVRISARPDPRGDYVVQETRELAPGETSAQVPLGEQPLRVHVLGRTRDGRLLRRAVISGLTAENWRDRWQRRASAS